MSGTDLDKMVFFFIFFFPTMQTNYMLKMYLAEKKLIVSQ